MSLSLRPCSTRDCDGEPEVVWHENVIGRPSGGTEQVRCDGCGCSGPTAMYLDDLGGGSHGERLVAVAAEWNRRARLLEFAELALTSSPALLPDAI